MKVSEKSHQWLLDQLGNTEKSVSYWNEQSNIAAQLKNTHRALYCERKIQKLINLNNIISDILNAVTEPND